MEIYRRVRVGSGNPAMGHVKVRGAPRVMNEPIPKLRTILHRGCRRRCPQCGGGPVYEKFLRMHERCAHCGLKFLHDQGDLWVYIIVVDRLVFILPLIGMLYFQFYNPYSVWFVLFAVALLGTLFYTVPHRNAICLGLDYWVRHKWGDLARPNSDPNPPAS